MDSKDSYSDGTLKRTVLTYLVMLPESGKHDVAVKARLQASVCSTRMHSRGGFAQTGLDEDLGWTHPGVTRDGDEIPLSVSPQLKC